MCLRGLSTNDMSKISRTRAILICAGEATRWAGHRDTPKHLIEIEGERLIDRTVRLLRERGVEQIFIVVREKSKAYEVEGATQWVATLNPEQNADADKFLSSRELWNPKGRTLFFYGDCYFSDEAMDTIVGHRREQWVLFCRPDASEITGKPWGECFAHGIYDKDLTVLEKMLRYVADQHVTGITHRSGGWELYRAMVGRKGLDLMEHRMSDHFIEINDWTEDFDYPEDYEKWIEARSALLQR